MLEAGLHWYHKFRGDLESINFCFSKYDPCVTNTMVSKLQHSIRFHVDDVLSSHQNPKVNDNVSKNPGELDEDEFVRGCLRDERLRELLNSGHHQ